jgi:hypothetical protein
MNARAFALFLPLFLNACGGSVDSLGEIHEGLWRVVHNATGDTLYTEIYPKGTCAVLDDTLTGEVNGAPMEVSSKGTVTTGSYYLVPYDSCGPIGLVIQRASQVVKAGEPVVVTVRDGSQSIQLRNEIMTSIKVALLPAATRHKSEPLEFEFTPAEGLTDFGWGELVITQSNGSLATWVPPTTTATRYNATVPLDGPGTYSWKLPIKVLAKNSWCLSHLACESVRVEATFTGTFVVDP